MTKPHQKKDNLAHPLQNDEQYFWSFDDGNHPGENTDISHNAMATHTTVKELKENLVIEEPEELDGYNMYLDADIPAEIWERLNNNMDKLPLEQIANNIKNRQTTSCEIARRPKSHGKWFIKTVWPLLWHEDVWLGQILSNNKEKGTWNIIVYLTFSLKHERPFTASVKAKIVSYPDQSKWDMINLGFVNQNTLSGPEFLEELKIANVKIAA